MGKSASKQSISEANVGNCMRFALVGSSGSGKSAFVNAVRGVDDEDENAAFVHIVDAGKSPQEYIYPSHPHVSLCDMPGYGTPSDPDVKNYWRKYQLKKFDTFLIFISDRVTSLDLAMIQKVKSLNKSFFLIRPKIDLVCKTKEDKPNFTEEELLSKIKNYIVKETDNLLCDKNDIFLVSNYYPYNEKWDFLRLIQAMINIMPAPDIDTTSDLTEHYLADAKMYVKANGVKGIEEYLKKKLEETKEVTIRFAITGDGGTGKSAFINAIRGLNDDDEGAAKVDVIETTTEATEYQHPVNPKICFVDLPGIGTPKYPNLQTYCKKVGLEEYDAFLIFTANRFTQHDLDLAEKVKSIGKSFFLVRTKIDNDCMPIKQKKPINEAEILQKIRKNCMDNVNNLISSEQGIFLISNCYTDKWDFDRLIKAISDALPVLQRECLTLSLSNVTRNCLKRKAMFFKAQAAAVAIISAGTGAIPIPGVGGVIDTVLIAGTITTYYRGFGLNNTTTEEMALLDKKCSEIIKRYQFRSVAEFASTIATKTFSLILGVEEVSKYIPIIGIVIAGSISFIFTLRYLVRTINELEEATIAVWDNAAKKSEEDYSSNTSTDIRKRPVCVKKIITTDGAVLKFDEITLKIVKHCKTKFTNTEISLLSRLIGKDWDQLAGLMNIPYSKRDEIRVNHPKYPDSSLKAEQVFVHFNSCEHSCRHHLEKCLKELGRGDLKNTMLPAEDENKTEEAEQPSCPPEVYEKENIENKTLLSPREMCRLSLRITAAWDSLAGLMGVSKEQRDNIRLNTVYYDDRARAEKILSIFNLTENFSRKKLAECFKEIGKLKLVEPVTTGEYRKL